MSSLSFEFGTVGSPKSTPNKPGGSIGAVFQITDLGLNSLELGWVRSVRISESTCSEIKQAAQDRGVSISVHAPYYINLNADGEEWPKSRKRLMDAAYYGYLSGATDIIFHPGSYFGKPAEEVMPMVIERITGCVEELQSGGIDVTLRPETMGKSAMLGSLQDTLLMSNAHSNIKPCLDFAHLHARTGDGTMNSYEEWIQVLDTYKKSLGSSSLKELHCHISGIEYTGKGEKEHLPIQESDFDYTALFKALFDLKCQGRMLCESPILEEDALFLQGIWMEISGEKKTA